MPRPTTDSRLSTPLFGRLYMFAQHEARAARERRGLPFGGLFGAATGDPAGAERALLLPTPGYAQQPSSATL